MKCVNCGNECKYNTTEKVVTELVEGVPKEIRYHQIHWCCMNPQTKWEMRKKKVEDYPELFGFKNFYRLSNGIK